MTDLQAIQARHSVRAYQDKKIEAEKAEALRELLDRLNKEYDLHMQLIEDVGGVFSGVVSKICGWSHVPSYIAMVGKDSESLDELCGYVGERVVLEAQKLGLNTCWAGIFKRKQATAEIREGERLALVIAIGYGVDSGHSRRSKTLSDVTDVQDMPDWFKAGVEAALLAPTARNQQKFFFTLDGGKPVARVTGNAPFAKLDLGIAKCHFEIGSGRTFI
ncbi:MAG: nitroreductase [Ruminococcus sp.]|nr:nitroreductase [Ruminococcus sp.]